MKIESLTIRGFRCFDDAGQTIELDDLTCLVGPNASGKTAAMLALIRLFGESHLQRQAFPADFHLGPGEQLRDRSPRSLSIECRLVFPELEQEGPITNAVPESFNQMIVDQPNGAPYCRIRLEATWMADGTSIGDIEQTISWILTESDDPAVIDGNRRKMHAGDRGKIRVVYVPAARGPDQQIKLTTGTIFGQLIEALSWQGADEALRGTLTALQEQLGTLGGIRTLNGQVQRAWAGFYDGPAARDVAFQAIQGDPTELTRLLVPTFQPGEAGRTMLTKDLSDGLRSLFSLSLSLGLFHVEELLRTTAAESGFQPEVVGNIPLLTVFAVEEPENHLSPHYLGRVVGQLEETARNPHAQVILSSHSPCILGRTRPDDVRYFLGHEAAASTRCRRVPLPEDEGDESFKYVREAVRGFPELYFSRLVVLGEGPSEEIVLRRLFEASGAPLDTRFISVVPLGGRHVNHFWRLLHGLEIPYLTLLDLDREKEGAGWGRIQYVRDQLVRILPPENLEFPVDGGATARLSDGTYDTLAENDVTDTASLRSWISYFRDTFDVFFSEPLDLDFSLLETFSAVYKTQAPRGRGPRLPDAGSPQYENAIDSRVKQVLAADASAATVLLGSTYTRQQRELFPWYKYLFIDGSKPVAHMRAMIDLSSEELARDSPATLKALVQRAGNLVRAQDGAG